jgi:O-antigen/teichoic acid export membrane protein
METSRRFAKNLAANYVQKIARSGIQVITMAIVARYLAPPSFGRYAYILAFLTIAEVTSGLGVPMILCREIAKDRTRAPVLIGAGLTLQFSLCIITLTALTLGFFVFTPSTNVFLAVLICAVSEVFEFLGRFFWSVYQGFEKMGYGTVQTFVSQVVRLLATIVAVHLDYGLHGVFGAMALGDFAGALFGYISASQVFARPQFTGTKTLVKYLWRESYPLAIRGVFRKFNYRVGTLLLAPLRSALDVGLFSGARNSTLHLIFISEASSQAVFPILSRFSSNSTASFNRAYQSGLKISMLLGLPLAVFLTVYSDQAVRLLLGKKYLESAVVMTILGWSLVPLFVDGFLQRVMVAGGKQGFNSFSMALGLVANTVLCLALIPNFGYRGAGIAALIGEVVPACLDLYFVRKYFGLRVEISVILKPLAAALTVYAVLSLLPVLNMFVGAALVVVVYGVSLLLIGALSVEEMNIVKQLLWGRQVAGAKTN